MKTHTGFTLLELLIAMFVFTIISLILAQALHRTINVQSGVERNAERLRQLQKTLLILSRDIEQAVDRPIWGANGMAQPAFIGTAQTLTCTYLGMTDPIGLTGQSALRRVAYHWQNQGLWRETWPVLDQAPTTQAQWQRLQTGVVGVRFAYLDHQGQFYARWPIESETPQPLPIAVRVTLTIANWGEISQLYVIAAQKH
ncbi:MAG TPA: type II secretion system minor pseudopilin GspJ [Gammaproteobacteria bacterium]|nr:type II secretion system minor pseudopilin GspJ [Gammaproteobacteria bacterium]